MMFKNILGALALSALFTANTLAQEKATAINDTIKKATKELPLEPTRNIDFKVTEATWMSLDVSP
ncbi:MAG: hypothetical protein ACI834_000520, partial [Colwellia sp.]